LKKTASRDFNFKDTRGDRTARDGRLARRAAIVSRLGPFGRNAEAGARGRLGQPSGGIAARAATTAAPRNRVDRQPF